MKFILVNFHFELHYQAIFQKSTMYVRMFIRIRFNRNIKRESDYISPGSYELLFSDGKPIRFDFNESYGYICKDNSAIVEFYLRSLDTDSFPDSEMLADRLEKKIVKSITEVFVYIGEESPDLQAVSLEDMSFLGRTRKGDDFEANLFEICKTATLHC
ncbi:MAG: hypothetical protein UIH27_01290 [Ruminococcus sp.]|nr:hypothetical protein [Ruminococcus sp.]